MIDPELAYEPKADPKESLKGLAEFLIVVKFPYTNEK